MEVFGKLYAQAAKDLPKGYAELGDIVLIDGSTEKKIIRENNVQPGSIVFYDAIVLMGSTNT